jgi:hydrogenase expression/formation protein HypE
VNLKVVYVVWFYKAKKNPQNANILANHVLRVILLGLAWFRQKEPVLHFTNTTYHSPMSQINEIRLAHGGGGRFSHQLIKDVFLSVFGNEVLNSLNDSAILKFNETRWAFTTDSFVVDPLFFPGGDIGRLAVCGTVNDLAVMGAKPLYLSIGFIIEEGFSIVDLKRIVRSIKNAADEAGVLIVAGDTKVVQKGNADGLFINTSGIGSLLTTNEISGNQAKKGDRILVNGSLGCHGMAIVTSREDYGFQTRIQSDVSPLNHLIEMMLNHTEHIHVMRDATRGGVATVLNEIAVQSEVGIELEETSLPVTEEVRGGCELLGFDPLYLANEGVLVAIVEKTAADSLLSVMKQSPQGQESAMIGSVTETPVGKVTMKTHIGSHRIVDMLSGEQLPRIC